MQNGDYLMLVFPEIIAREEEGEKWGRDISYEFMGGSSGKLKQVSLEDEAEGYRPDTITGGLFVPVLGKFPE